jgi:hypothetical protein
MVLNYQFFQGVEMKLKILSITTFLLVASCFGSTKDKFLAAVKKDCGLEAAEAKKLLTPGRNGTVTKFRVCVSSPIKLSDSCSINCSANSGNVVGN